MTGNKVEIRHSIYGRNFGWVDGRLIVNSERTNKGLGAEVLVEGIQRTTITTAQVLALFATPITIVAAPGVGNAVIVRAVGIHKPAGTAYGGIAAGEDMVCAYTDENGEQVTAQIETTGFLDSAAAQTRWVYAASADAAVADIAPVDNAVIVLKLIIGEIITGTSDLIVHAYFDVVPMVLTA